MLVFTKMKEPNKTILMGSDTIEIYLNNPFLGFDTRVGVGMLIGE